MAPFFYQAHSTTGKHTGGGRLGWFSKGNTGETNQKETSQMETNPKATRPAKRKPSKQNQRKPCNRKPDKKKKFKQHRHNTCIFRAIGSSRLSRAQAARGARRPHRGDAHVPGGSGDRLDSRGRNGGGVVGFGRETEQKQQNAPN